MGSGCDEFGSVGDVHHIRGLQGEGGGALPGHGGMWAVVVMCLVVLGMLFLHVRGLQGEGGGALPGHGGSGCEQLGSVWR